MALARAETPLDALPRIAPPLPSRSAIADYLEAAERFGIDLFAWQAVAATYMQALDAAGGWLWPEVAIVVARQNGKTELLLPKIIDTLDHGGRILHTAQNRELPRGIFLRIADYYRSERAGDVAQLRYANGQETLRLHSGASYTIIAPQRGARGHSVDLLLVDEVREYADFDFMGAALPTLTASSNPQVVYLSNAGHESSVVLNDLRRRAGTDPSLCYIEWSAAPERSIDDREGWREANPSPIVTLEYLERAYHSRPPALFETEHLCRWVTSLAPGLVSMADWDRLNRPLEPVTAPSLGIAVDPGGRRCSAAVAWPQSDGTLALTMLAEVEGTPIDLDAFGAALKKKAAELKVRITAYDPATDEDLARHLDGPKAKISPREFAQASERFARSVEGGRLRHSGADPVSADLPYTARKLSSVGVWHATRAMDDRPITGALAAIRAVWMAAAPLPPKPALY